MIVVEGPDGGGKTTLVRKICSQWGLLEGERGVPDRDKLYTVTRQDTYRALSMAVGGEAPVKVWDRLFISELVYSGVMNRPCEFSTSESGFIHEILKALRCPVIFCIPPVEVVKENITKDKQMIGVADNIDYIWGKYRGLADIWCSQSPRYIEYDYTDRLEKWEWSRVQSRINDYLGERTARTWSM